MNTPWQNVMCSNTSVLKYQIHFVCCDFLLLKCIYISSATLQTYSATLVLCGILLSQLSHLIITWSEGKSQPYILRFPEICHGLPPWFTDIIFVTSEKNDREKIHPLVLFSAKQCTCKFGQLSHTLVFISENKTSVKLVFVGEYHAHEVAD